MAKPTAPWHWAEYGIEAAALGLFMASAAFFTVVLEHPESPVHQALAASDALRRLLMGVAMGMTAATIIYSPFGARSGAHMNPATTLTFARLGRIAPRDAVVYAAAQGLGGLAGLSVAAFFLRTWIADPHVGYVATRPGIWGSAAAFGAEAFISFVMMTAVLRVSNGRHARWTGACAGVLVALFILIEAPVSGMSMNPARSLAPALVSGDPSGIWIYFTAPLVGMFTAAEIFVRRRGLHEVRCAKLNHAGGARCIFHCRMDMAPVSTGAATV
jgi:aquaporin Z